MALVVNEHEFTDFMRSRPLDTKWLGTQYKITGKKPYPQKTPMGENVVVIFSDTQVYMRRKCFCLEELFRFNGVGVYVDMPDTASLSTIVFHYYIAVNLKEDEFLGECS